MEKSAEAFRTISEVADELQVPKHVLRFWEGKFGQIKPMKRGGGRRYYRPEDVELSPGKPQRADNVWEGVVDQKVFLGEVVDLQVKLGERTLISRQHPSLRSRVGDPIFIQLDPEKCVALRVA